MTLTFCLVTEPPTTSLDAYVSFLHQAILGGVTIVQFRDKKSSFELKYSTCMTIKTLLSNHHIPLIINDDITLAKAIDADGIHLGQSDKSPEAARQALGENKIIGLSIETIEQLHVANQLDCIDYVAASAVFNSTTKRDCKTVWGLEGLKTVVQQSIHPVMAIGGITTQNARSIIACGAAGIAVVSALHQSLDPAYSARIFIQEINKGAHDVQKHTS